MMRAPVVLATLAFLGALATGCVVESRPAYGRCPGGYWIEGHYGPHGRWHRGHWRCPGIVEEVEIE
jgi:hypothetical protein